MNISLKPIDKERSGFIAGILTRPGVEVNLRHYRFEKEACRPCGFSSCLHEGNRLTVRKLARDLDRQRAFGIHPETKENRGNVVIVSLLQAKKKYLH
jgi:hypothetical protein